VHRGGGGGRKGRGLSNPDGSCLSHREMPCAGTVRSSMYRWGRLEWTNGRYIEIREDLPENPHSCSLTSAEAGPARRACYRIIGLLTFQQLPLLQGNLAPDKLSWIISRAFSLQPS
jgi:hypothetical protein